MTHFNIDMAGLFWALTRI